MSSASSSPTALAIQRWTAAVCRRTKSPNASSSPSLDRAMSSSSVGSGGAVSNRSRPVENDAIVLSTLPRPSSTRLAPAVRVRRVPRLEPARPLSARQRVVAFRQDAETHELPLELVSNSDPGGRDRLFVELGPADWVVGPFADSGRGEAIRFLSRRRGPGRRRVLPAEARRSLRLRGAARRAAVHLALHGGRRDPPPLLPKEDRLDRPHVPGVSEPLRVGARGLGEEELARRIAGDLPAGDLDRLSGGEHPLGGAFRRRAPRVDDVPAVDGEGHGDPFRGRVRELEREVPPAERLDVDLPVVAEFGGSATVDDHRELESLPAGGGERRRESRQAEEKGERKDPVSHECLLEEGDTAPGRGFPAEAAPHPGPLPARGERERVQARPFRRTSSTFSQKTSTSSGRV